MIPSAFGLIVMAIGLVMLRYALIGDVFGAIPQIFPSGAASGLNPSGGTEAKLS
jgi:hypothetical protein